MPSHYLFLIGYTILSIVIDIEGEESQVRKVAGEFHRKASVFPLRPSIGSALVYRVRSISGGICEVEVSIRMR